MAVTPLTRCEICGEVIGVYEPMVCVGDDGVRRTSALAEPPRRSDPEHSFHGACYPPAPPSSDRHE
jgi:hypothetical protein